MITVEEKVLYKGLENCIRISNGSVELIATTKFGPRVLRYAFINKENVFVNIDEQIQDSAPQGFKLYGGHRFWVSPENNNYTDIPDNKPVKYEVIKNGVILTTEIDELSKLKKVLTLTMEISGKVTAHHELINKNGFELELAPWAISVMAPGGFEIMPMPTVKTGYLPNRSIVLWPYSKMTDTRMTWGDKYLFLKHDVSISKPFKLGYLNVDGWAAYIINNDMFVKHHSYIEGANYPDMTCSYETYTCDTFTETETVAPLSKIPSGGSACHEEQWELFENVSIPSTEEECQQLADTFIYKK